MMNKKQAAAELIAGMMMAHFQGPLDDSSFYYDYIEGEGTEAEQKAAVYYDENKYDLADDKEFLDMVSAAVKEELYNQANLS